MRFIATAAIVGVLMGAPLTVHAASESNYTPDDPSAATLVGSVLTCECRSEERFIDYQVRVTAPDGQSAAGDAVLSLDLGARTVSVPLGTLSDGAVSGRIPWPGDPGVVDPVVDATVTVAGVTPPLAVPLSVPECDTALAASSLPATGLPGWVAPLGGVGALLLVTGVVVRSVRRSRVP